MAVTCVIPGMRHSRDATLFATRLLPHGLARFAAFLADTMHFKRLRARLESVLARLLDEKTRHALVADLDDAGATAADQKRHLMRFVRMMAADERVDRFELVNEAVLEQEIERAIHGRGRGAAAAFAELVEQVVR